MAREGEFDEAVDDLREVEPGSPPHLGVAGNVRETGAGVQLVDEQLFGVAAQKEIDARETAQSSALKASTAID